MTTRIHVSLPVSDLDRSIEFYQRLFGTGPTKLQPDYANFRLDEPPIHLALESGSNPVTGFHGHLGIELPDHEYLEQVRSRAPEGRDEDQAMCCYAKGDKTWFDDPDGHRWEVWVRTGDYGALAPPEASTGCCA